MAEKKAALRKEGYPDKLLALLDKNGKCYKQVYTAPDQFTIRLVYSNQKKNYPWTQHDEDPMCAKRAHAGLARSASLPNDPMPNRSGTSRLPRADSALRRHRMGPERRSARADGTDHNRTKSLRIRTARNRIQVGTGSMWLPIS